MSLIQGQLDYEAGGLSAPVVTRATRRDAGHTQPSTRQSARSPIVVREVKSRRDLDEFIRLPWRIYANDPQWVPPLVCEVKAFLDRGRHPFYRHGEATQFVAYRDSEPVGRILASDDLRYNEQHGTGVGCFGMFESIDDVEVARSLLSAASTWLVRRGRTSIRGPIDYSMNYPCGLLVDGFDTPPRVMMNHHRPYYGRLLDACGLGKSKDLYAWWFTDELDMLSKWRLRLERLAQRGGVSVRPVDFNDFEAELARVIQVYNEAWEEHWGFVKMTEAELQHLASDLQRLADPNLVLLAEVEGRPVGLSMTLPDWNEPLSQINGRLDPWSLVKLAYYRRKITTARMAVLGVTEGYRRRGIAEMLILQTLDYGKNVLGYSGAELSWTLEDNTLINRTIEAVGGRRYKTYRVFEKPLG